MSFSKPNKDDYCGFDKIQLIGSTIQTPTQMQAFRDKIGTSGITHRLRVFAILNDEWLQSISCTKDVDQSVDQSSVCKIDEIDLQYPIAKKRLEEKKMSKSEVKVTKEREKKITKKLMPKKSKYSCTLAVAYFLFFELKQVLHLKEQGLQDSEIKEQIRAENLFGYNAKSSIKSSLTSVLRRINVLDDTLRRMVIEKPAETGKIVNLYAIMKTDRLFFEFINEVIREKLEQNDYHLERKEVNVFMTAKAEQDDTVAAWTEKTVNKLKQAYIKVLCDAGIVRDRKTGDLSRILMDVELKRHLVDIGDKAYVKAMGEWVE